MAKKRKTLPKEITSFLETGDIDVLKEQFSQCEPDAVSGKYGSNIFSLTPLPREFAFWAKEQGADVNFKDYYFRAERPEVIMCHVLRLPPFMAASKTA